MTNVLYIGNKLNHKQSNISAIAVLGPLLEDAGYKLRYASSRSNKVIRLFDMIWACLSSFRKTDCVLIDTYSTQNFYYAFIISQLSRLLGLDYIPILHGGNLEQRLQDSPNLSSLIFKNAKINVAPSPFIKFVFEEYGYLNTALIPNTLNLNNYSFQHRPIKSIKILWVRSFSNIYNPTLAIKILKLLIEKGYKSELCMVGPDTGDDSYQKTHQLAEKLSVDVIFTGKLSKAEWIDLAKGYNIFINTTNYDNMPVSVIEAMALGLPVVSTNVGGIPYLINDGLDGILVEPNDENKFVDAIIKLHSQPDLTKNISLNARNKVQQYDWSIIKQKWYEILE